jgi:hypothetical protein
MKTLSQREILVVAVSSILLASGCTGREAPLEPKRVLPAEANRFLIPAVGAYTQIEAGYETCGLRNDGVLRCWAPFLAFEKRADVGSFTSFTWSLGHGCALRTDGAVQCWGINNVGEAPPLVTPPNGSVFIDVDNTTDHSCGTRNDGVIQCWGDNRFLQSETRVASDGLFRSVGVGHQVTCGLTSLGVIECFGDIGHPGFISGHVIFSPSSGSFTKLVMRGGVPCGIRTGGVVECRQHYDGTQHIPLSGSFIDYGFGTGECGIDVAGVAHCAGLNEYGEAPATRTASTGSFTRIAPGAGFTCGLRSDGGVDCWGARFYGAYDTVLPTATFVAPASVVVGQPIQLSLVDPQVPGYPQATTFTYAFDCGGGSFSPFEPGSISTATCPTSTTGTRVVRGKVTDQDFAETIYSATVTIKTAEQTATDLRTDVQLAPLAPDIRRALMTKLDAALSAIAKGKINAACSALKDFINQVNAQKGKAIPTATADAWILTAQQLQAAIGC